MVGNVSKGFILNLDNEDLLWNNVGFFDILKILREIYG